MQQFVMDVFQTVRMKLQTIIIAGLATTTMAFTPVAKADSAPQPASHVPERALTAIMRYANTNLEEWHYTREWAYDGEVRIDHHDPSRPGAEHWQLVSIDGRAPTAAEIKEYNEDRDSHEEESEERFDNEDVLRMLAPGTVKLIGQDGNRLRYGYRMQSPNGKKKRLYRPMLGDLTVVQEGEDSWVEQVRVWNDEPVRPVIGVRISDVAMDFQFTRQGEAVLPAGVDVTFAGKFLLLKNIDRQIQVRLTDFARVADITASQ